MKKGFLSEKDYDFIYSRSPRLCVDLIIQTPKGIIFTKRNISPWKNKWHLVGGRVLFKESLEIACKRIAKRELGVKIKVKDFLGYTEFPEEKNRHSVSLAFLAEISGGKLSLNKEEATGLKITQSAPLNTIHQHRRLVISFLKRNAKHNL